MLRISGDRSITAPTRIQGPDGTVITDWGAAPLAALQALGTGVATVGDVARVTDKGNIEATCSAVEAGLSTWTAYRRREKAISYTDTTTARRFFPWNGQTAVGDASIGAPQSAMSVGHNGRVLGVSLYSLDTANLDTVTIGVHLNENTTPAESDALEVTAIDTRYDFEFATEFLVASHKRVHISIASDNTRGQIAALVHYEVDLLSGSFA